MAWQALRQIVEELDVAEYVDLFTEKHKRFDEAWNALKWLLSRNPEPKGSYIKVTAEGRRYRAYVLAGDMLAGTPDLWVVYSYTDTEVVILSVHANEPTEDADEEEET